MSHKKQAKQIARRLVRLRGHRTQSAVARAIGISRQALDSYERGTLPGTLAIMALGDGYSVTSSYIIWGRENV